MIKVVPCLNFNPGMSCFKLRDYCTKCGGNFLVDSFLVWSVGLTISNPKFLFFCLTFIGTGFLEDYF